jgi:hypothetical protein
MQKNKLSIFISKYLPMNKPHRVIIAIIIIALLAFRLTVFIRDYKQSPKNTNQENMVPVQTNESVEGNQRATGVMTFFHKAPLIGQIKIFNDWEGKYRTKEEGNKISFIFLKTETGTEPVIFSISYYPEKDWAENKSAGSKVLATQDNTVFVLTANSGNSLEGQEADQFRVMAGDVAAIIQTFRAIELNP